MKFSPNSERGLVECVSVFKITKRNYILSTSEGVILRIIIIIIIVITVMILVMEMMIIQFNSNKFNSFFTCLPIGNYNIGMTEK
jgi:hypothetical protein